MASIKIGGKDVQKIGFGLMGMTWRMEPPPREQSFRAMKEALKDGCNFWNGGEIYGNPERNSLHLLREYFDEYPEDKGKVVISIKGGMVHGKLIPDGSAENTKRSIQECIDILSKTGKKLDIWEAARVDTKTPIEITMRTAKEFIDAGKLGGVSLSECSADTIRRASKVVKVDAVEVEFSLWATEIFHNGVAKACAELNIPIVAYSPLGQGFLTGQVKSIDDLGKNDRRRFLPRFSPENFQQNIKLVDELKKIAERKGCTPGQVGISWILAQSGRNGNPVFIPIPGATTPERVAENSKTVHLDQNDMEQIDQILASVDIQGGRYGEQEGLALFGDSAPLNE
ncbi:Aldo/keto reductase [Piedraia hortae CBS 480.64]|uniref:Aldo/keto reductase n=1 Tax=Piedraia hortae CBS 480.64 TaxID=1314780 RepID=A0A6A7BUP9_9PEZI|nr:Aldo/keto reductase [Piedraia hortae CBS 480.64]